MSSRVPLGRKIRRLRTGLGLTQDQMADRLSISASYLSLMENDRRPVSADMLLALADEFDLDLRKLSRDEDGALLAGLNEALLDPLYEDQPVVPEEIERLVAEQPGVARAILNLHHAYITARTSAETLADQVQSGLEIELDRSRLSSEQVSDLIQRHANHYPELELEAERVWREGRLDREELYGSLSQYLEGRHRVRVRVQRVGDMGGAVRRYDPGARVLDISETLRRGSRTHQLAYQIGLLECGPILDRLATAPELTSEESRALARVALANYFGAAVMMPYVPFLKAAEDARYDIELLGHRFRASFEQVCHRFTTLRRPGAEGVPFHMIRIDIAGNISKKFSGPSGVRFPRFAGLCPLWNVHAAFLQPGVIRSQLSRLPDGMTYFSVARTVQKHRGGFHEQRVLYAIALGCDIEEAHRLVYADGVDLSNTAAAVPVGTTCRLCERMDCEARAFPSIRRPLRVDELVRSVSFYAPVDNG